MSRTSFTPAYAVPVWRAGADIDQLPDPLFTMLFYGPDADLIYAVGEETGGAMVQAALRQRGLEPDDFWTSVWFITEERRP